MMSIFGTPFCAPQTHYQYQSEPSLIPLFRLLDDFENYNREVQEAAPQPKRRRQSPAPLPRFKPKFDVRETENTYELHGELPGIEKENLNIEFTDPRTIQIHGRVERTKEQQPEPEEEEEHHEVTEPAAEPEKTTNNHHATVEDDPEEMETSSTTSWTPVSSPKPEAAKPVNAEVTKKADKTEVQKAAPKKVAMKNNANKIWLWERSIGEFNRTFEFPTDVDHDGVSASLNNGVLTVTVPKKTQRGPVRISIF